MSFSRFLLLLAGSSLAALAFVLWKFARFLYDEWTSPLRKLPGPPNGSLLYGNMKQVLEAVRYSLSAKFFTG